MDSKHDGVNCFTGAEMSLKASPLKIVHLLLPVAKILAHG